MTEAPASRAEQKERTRRAILDAALGLCDDAPLAALSLRQVAKQVGIVPTAFYRHFASIEDLGLALVQESLVSLRAVLRDVRQGGAPEYRTIIDRSVAVLVEHVRAQRAHFAFIARERMAGPAGVRQAIADGIVLFEAELAADLARLPGTSAWSSADLRIVSNLIVSAMVTTAEELVAIEPGSSEEERVAHYARTQLRMLLVGATHWRSRP
ncbi:TetR family transcriptional regulator [Nocardioides sp. GY 10113]|uniref:TetR family transcriptional regulator n=1 Tax=Nocardioides sp. GY 10113 TaxID=2569761 RepID=UPI0010A8F362|nr:TetR family transcriptional regulator [Nocardioides sp. GY 10113]TIC88794.1 TetR family transcriptional regulator [Nocardioides sp. GY 10113]